MSAPYFRLVQGREMSTQRLHIQGNMGLEFLDAKPLLDAWEPLVLTYSSIRRLPDLFEMGGRRIVSPRLRAILVLFRANAEFLPVTVQNNAGVTARSFSILHPLELIDCIDYVNSEFDRYGTGSNFTVARYKRLVFDNDVVAGRHFFKPQRDASSYVSTELRSSVELAGLQVRFEPLEGSDSGVP